ncbi:MAG: type II toxin-antitoxin system HicB family antitoxin [Candidatus Omnitrophica bacterium]|nr:type II toxin-antitoxin system HicB family antitoxin [Candidatus Omnitrophota bacterium]
MQRFKLNAIIWKEDAGFVSKCSELGVASAGDSLEDALRNLKEAVELYIENATELGMIGDFLPSLKAEEKFSSPIEVMA